MLRISRIRRGNVAVVRVEGRLEDEGVEELQKEFAVAERPLELDLAALLSADEVGLALLRSLRDAGVTLTGVSPFLQLLLKGPEKLKGPGKKMLGRGDAA